MHFHRKTTILSILILGIFQIHCGTKREALGADNEIRVICSDIDKQIVRNYLTSIFTDTIFTPEPEPYYYLKFSGPETYNDLKAQSQVIVAAVERDKANTGYNLVKKMLPPDQFQKTESGDPVIFAKNVNARKQLFIVINAESEDQLMSTVESKKNFIRKQFFDQFVDRQSRFIFGSDRNKKLEDSLATEFSWRLKIPWGWEMIKSNKESRFVWLGKERPFQWIGIAWEEGNLVDDGLRTGDYIWGWPGKHYGFIRFNDYKFEMKEAPYKNHQAWRAQGIWETIDVKEAKGGPFRSYVFYDEKQDRTYHLNYLIHHPGNDKSIFMRQLDLIVKTFTTVAA
tara:strand:- start:1814 stop:2833 length:1020 start_codon:yes stop_codon:yes gene_type:complete